MATRFIEVNDGTDNCSLVVFPGDNAIADDRKRELAENSGIKLYRLRYKEYIETRHSLNFQGFQNVKIITNSVGKKRFTQIVEMKHPVTQKPWANAALRFVGDDLGVGYAWIPDLPLNRVKLAAALDNSFWVIEDKEYLEKIKKLAAEIKESSEYKDAMDKIERMQDQIRMKNDADAKNGGNLEISALEAENHLLEKKIYELEAAKRHKELKEKLERLKKVSDKTTVPQAEPPKIDPNENEDGDLNAANIVKELANAKYTRTGLRH